VWSRDAELSLATFLARLWTAPNRLGLAFPIDRRALAGHRDLELSEARIRGAICLLEEVGLLEREETFPGAKFQRTAEGLHRRPILFRFGPDFLELFRSARRSLPGHTKPRERRNPTPARTFAGSGNTISATPAKSPKSTSDVPTILPMGEVRRLSRENLPPRDQPRSDSRLEAALKRLGEAVGVKP